VVQRADLARVGQQPLRARHPVDLDGPRALVDQQYLVAVFQKFLGDGPADRAGPGDGDAHQWAALPGAAGRANTAVIRLRSLSLALTSRTPPSRKQAPGPGRIPS